jgi:hypothetical protein
MDWAFGHGRPSPAAEEVIQALRGDRGAPRRVRRLAEAGDRPRYEAVEAACAASPSSRRSTCCAPPAESRATRRARTSPASVAARGRRRRARRPAGDPPLGEPTRRAEVAGQGAQLRAAGAHVARGARLDRPARGTDAADEKNTKPMSDALRQRFLQRRQRVMLGLGRTKTSHPANQWQIDEINRAQDRGPQAEADD